MMLGARRLFAQDVEAWSGGSRVRTLAVCWHLLTDSSLSAVWLLRVQCASRSRLLAAILRRLNASLNGIDVCPGFRAGERLRLPHPHGVVLGRGARVGNDCTIMQNVTLGERYADGADTAHLYPSLRDRVVVGAGAVVLGGVVIGDATTIGANAVVLSSTSPGSVVVGIPAASIETRHSEARGSENNE